MATAAHHRPQAHVSAESCCHESVFSYNHRAVNRLQKGHAMRVSLYIGVLLLVLQLTLTSVAGQRLDYVNDLKDDEELAKPGQPGNATDSQDSFADMVNRVLEKEFPDKDAQEGSEQLSWNRFGLWLSSV